MMGKRFQRAEVVRRAPVNCVQPVNDTTTTPERICGWCQCQLAPGTQPATTGICPKCFVRLTLQDGSPLPDGVVS